jgi:hypothetical protein
MNDFSAALRDALLVPKSSESLESVRVVVINQLKQLDPEAKIHATGYFNHSWIPDLDLSWKSSEDTRQLFLRFNVRDDAFAEDMRFVITDDGDPVFLDIAQPDLALEGYGEAASVDEKVISHSAAMVTEHKAWGRLGVGVAQDADARTATRQVVRGGRGLVDEEVADRVLTDYSAASELLGPGRVREVDPGQLREVLNRLEVPLSRIARLDLETDLRSRWVEGGRDPELFPNLEGWALRERLPSEIADFVLALLRGGEPVPEERWQEVVEAITADRLGAESRGKHRVTGGKLNDLVRVGADAWTARWAWVPVAGPVPARPLDWSLGGTALEVNLADRRAVFADLGNRFNTMPKPDADELPRLEHWLETLDDRAVLGVTVLTMEEQVGVQLRATATETLGGRLRALMAADADLRILGRIARIEVRVPGREAVLEINFETGKARADKPIPIGVFARLVGRFMVNLPAAMREELRARLARDVTP